MWGPKCLNIIKKIMLLCQSEQKSGIYGIKITVKHHLVISHVNKSANWECKGNINSIFGFGGV